MREKTKSEPTGKIGKPGEVLSSTMLEQHAMQSSPEAKRKKRKNDVTTSNRKEESNSNDAWKCKSCEEIWHGEDDNRNLLQRGTIL